jgi:anthranilate phosphoribosyltransferase
MRDVAGRHACPTEIALRPLLGVRTAMQTAAKLVSSFPAGRARRAVGVFHAPYLETTATSLRLLGATGLVVQALGGLPEARPGKTLRAARTNGEPACTIDLRALPAGAPAPPPPDDAPVDGAAENLAALRGEAGPAHRAAAAAGVLLHAATGADPIDAATAALRALEDGRAATVADRLRA